LSNTVVPHISNTTFTNDFGYFIDFDEE